MYIRSLRATNLRCYTAADVTFSPTITILAGDNNSGKSTLIQALYRLQNGSRLGTESIRFGAPQANITIEFSEPDQNLFPAPNRQHLAGVAPVVAQIDFTATPNNVSMQIGSPTRRGAYTPFPDQQPHNLFVPYLSDRRTGNFTEQVNHEFAFRAGGNLATISNKVDRCLTSDELGPIFKDTCRRVFGFALSTQHLGNGKMAGLELNARNKQFIPLERLGSGVAQAAGLIVELLLTEKRIFLIEELENDLHPTALRALLELVERSASDGNQFIISTHSNIIVRRLGSLSGTRIWQTSRIGSSAPPESTAVEVPNEPSARIGLLRSLGYDLSDYELYDAWLVLEESSAERIIREFVIPWFAARLSGRLCTVAAQGAPDVAPRFIDLHRIFVFAHKQRIYNTKSWAIVDGDTAGQEAIRKLRSAFATWPPEHFQCFSRNNFEEYYPTEFESRVQQVLGISDAQRRRSEKAVLCKDVVEWLRADPNRGRSALADRAKDVIDLLQRIESQVASIPSAS